MLPLLLILSGCCLLFLAMRVYHQPLAGDRIAYWHNSIPRLEEDPQRFYARVYQALKAGLERQQVELSDLGFGPVRLFETHSVFSYRPLYFSARYKHLTYYVFASPTPSGLFLSTWMFSALMKGGGGEGKSLLLPGAYRYYARQTMFQHDAVLLFEEAMHAVVLEVVDLYRAEKSLAPLEEYERRPIYHAFYQSVFPVHQAGVALNQAPNGSFPAADGMPLQSMLGGAPIQTPAPTQVIASSTKSGGATGKPVNGEPLNAEQVESPPLVASGQPSEDTTGYLPL